MSLATRKTNVIKLSLVERDFRGYSLVQYSILLGLLMRSDPKPPLFLLIIQHSLEPRRQDTVGLCPSKHLLSAAKDREDLPIHLTISKLPPLARLN